MDPVTDPQMDQRFARLQEYLQDGWSIDQPIFVRPVWHTIQQQKEAYHFILKRGEALHLFVIPLGPEVVDFVQAHNFSLNRL